MCLIFFFFFQAEDGIRDVAVTGVQTCALPILLGIGGVRALAKLGLQIDTFHFNEGHAVFAGIEMIAERMATGVPFKTARSEERRVGKECRSRWSPYH